MSRTPQPSRRGATHPRNRYQGHYDLKSLLESDPDLARFALPNRAQAPSIDFAHPEAVKALNRALLRQYYGIRDWDFPPQYLCPPIPGRADYIHHLADLLAVNARANGRLPKSGAGGGKEALPRGPEIRVLDIGTGANLIYPILGHCEYGWSFVGTDLDPVALESARKILAANPGLGQAVELREQTASPSILDGIIRPGERFEITMCNPPFHASAEEAHEVNLRKWRNLGRAPVSNFGGQSNELWVEGGEVAFITRMIDESRAFGSQCLWFTSLVSKETTLPLLYTAIQRAQALEYRVIDMEQGQKRSRLIAWTYRGGKGEWPPRT
jgi:23S rRNA (adenine1618-N6)-methyltransferase